MSAYGSPVFYIVAGEASGDRHAAELLRELRRLCPEGEYPGVGGKHLLAAGQKQLFDLAEHAVVGLTDVLLNYNKFKGFFDRVVADIVERKPAVLILVDFPGFNLRLAARVKQVSPATKILYYISPQVWAWKSGRVKQMQKIIDHLLVIFPFEKEWMTERAPALRTTWVGHPILDRWEVIHKDVEPLPPRIALLPGSRIKEVRAHLAIMLRTAKKLASVYPGARFLLLAPDEAKKDRMKEIIRKEKAEGLALDLHVGYQLTHLSRCHLAMVASGTATLECALADLPMLIVYRVNPATFAIGRRLVKLPYIGMVNVIAGEKIVPEFLQSDATPEKLAAAARVLLDKPEAARKMKERLRAVVGQLGSNVGASRRAAEEALALAGEG